MCASFDLFVGVDWSGAKGTRLSGLQVAVAEPGESAPKLVSPPKERWWSRDLALDWILERIKNGRVLVGFDFSFAYAYLDFNCYFPGLDNQPRGPFDLWSLVEKTCHHAPDFYGGPFYIKKDLPYGRYFLSPYGKGDRYTYRQRLTEKYCGVITTPNPVMKCIGAANVGTGSLAGMRLLNYTIMKVRKNIAIWPFQKTDHKSIFVEIFPRLFFRRAKTNPREWRDVQNLNKALEFYCSKPMPSGWHPSREDEPDALISSAALRNLSKNSHVWSPPISNPLAMEFEGWIFGVDWGC